MDSDTHDASKLATGFFSAEQPPAPQPSAGLTISEDKEESCLGWAAGFLSKVHMGKLHKKKGKRSTKHEKEAFILQVGLPAPLSLWTESISKESPGSTVLYS